MSLPAEHFVRVPVAELTSPEKAGPLNVYRDRWWAIDKDGNALFFTGGRRGSRSPQCNVSRAVVEHIAQNYPHETTATLLPWAYVQFSISDYT